MSYTKFTKNIAGSFSVYDSDDKYSFTLSEIFGSTTQFELNWLNKPPGINDHIGGNIHYLSTIDQPPGKIAAGLEWEFLEDERPSEIIIDRETLIYLFETWQKLTDLDVDEIVIERNGDNYRIYGRLNNKLIK